MRQPRLTIGLPFHREDETAFAMAVRSVFAQTVEDWELLLIADDPSPALLALARRIDDPRVRLVHDGQARGLATRLNEIAVLAVGPVLVRFDADDIMRLNRLSILDEFLGANPAVDIVGSHAVAISSSGRPLGRFIEPPLPMLPEGYIRSNALTHPTVAGRTAWFRVNQYDEAYPRAEDKELWLRTSGTSQFAKVARPLYFYRIATRRLSSKLRSNRASDRKVLREYGPALVGQRITARLLVESYAKDVAGYIPGMAIASIGRRYAKPLESEMRVWEDELTAIENQVVPGW
jgi:glycosyltransferase involved in cell wall biosynthesis